MQLPPVETWLEALETEELTDDALLELELAELEGLLELEDLLELEIDEAADD